MQKPESKTTTDDLLRDMRTFIVGWLSYELDATKEQAFDLLKRINSTLKDVPCLTNQ